MENRRMGKSKSAQETNCVDAWSTDGGLFFPGDETKVSKSTRTCAYILREPLSLVEHVSTGEKYGDGSDDYRAGGNSAEFKRGGGAGPKAHEQIDVYEERCVNGDESAGDAE
jgi:hypothetical protein